VHYEVKNGKGQHINPVTLLFPGRAVSRGYAWRDVGPGSLPVLAAANVASKPLRR
jgi:hypothetical protein